MADISKLVAPDGSEYNIKDSVARRAHNPVAINSRTFTNVIAASNDNEGGGFFYLRFRGTTYQDYWHVKVRVKAWCPSNANYEITTTFDIFGYANTYSWFACLNKLKSTSYRPIYYNSLFLLSSTGYNNGCYNYIGFNLANATNPTSTSYKRSVTVELLQYENCEAELLDELVTPTNIPNRAAHTNWYSSTNTSYNNFNALSYGLKQSGDADTTTITTLSNGAGSYTIDSAVYRYQLLFEKDANTLTPLNNNNNTTDTTKTMLTEVEFDPFGRIYYYGTTTTLAAGAIGGAGSYLWANAGADLRYTFNITTTSFTAHQAVYLVVTPTSGGKCKIASALPVTQTLPNTADGNWYILLGRAYSGYQIGLWPEHPVYMHNGTSIQRVLPQTALANSTTAGLMTPAEKTKLSNISELPSCVEWTPSSGDTILAFVTALDRTNLPFTFVKKGSVSLSDGPTNNYTEEFTGIVSGYGDRIRVTIKHYGPAQQNVEYSRDIWQNSWNESGWDQMNTWRPLVIKEYTASGNRSAAAGGLISIQANEFKDSSNNPASIPDGYTPIGIIDTYPGSGNVSLSAINLYAEGTDIMVIYKAHSAMSNTSMTSRLKVSYLKT